MHGLRPLGWCDVSEPNPRMLFEAGRVGGSRCWRSPLLIDVSAVESLEPAGAPLVILVHEAEITAADARTTAALIGAGREAVILSGNGVSDDVAGWFPEGLSSPLICSRSQDPSAQSNRHYFGQPAVLRSP
jgi:hypothetical protein